MTIVDKGNVPIAWVAQMLGCNIGKAQRMLKAQGGNVPLEDFIEFVEKRYRNNTGRYNYLIKEIEKIELRFIKEGHE
jgi:hypothetical protein